MQNLEKRCAKLIEKIWIIHVQHVTVVPEEGEDFSRGFLLSSKLLARGHKTTANVFLITILDYCASPNVGMQDNQSA